MPEQSKETTEPPESISVPDQTQGIVKLREVSLSQNEVRKQYKKLLERTFTVLEQSQGTMKLEGI